MNEALKEKLKNKIKSIYSSELVDTIFSSPFINIDTLKNKLVLTRQTASKYLSILENEKILKLEKTGKDKIYYYEDLLNELSKSAV